ncbi:MAG: 2-phosphosulfolactate phosphatase [Methanobacteriaceae archaeon]
MKINLTLEKAKGNDLAIMVDALRASTTITIVLDNFNEIIPVENIEDARKIAETTDGSVLAGERSGAKIEDFDFGNSPVDIQNATGNSLVLTTSNGTRIMGDMKINMNNILIGSFINAKSVAEAAMELGSDSIDVVMAGVQGRFAIEDFLASGEILYWINKEISQDMNLAFNSNAKLSEFAKSAILARSNWNEASEAVLNSRSSKRLHDLGLGADVNFCLKRNISKNVAIYDNGVLKPFNK